MFAGPFKISLTQLFLRFKGKLDCLYNNIFCFNTREGTYPLLEMYKIQYKKEN